MDLGIMELSADAAFNPDLANALDGFEADAGDAFFGHPFMIDGPGDDGSASMMGDDQDDDDDDGASGMFFMQDNPVMDEQELQNSSARSSSRRPKKNGHAPSVSPSNSDATDPLSDSDTLDSLPGDLLSKSSSGSRKRGRLDGGSGHETKSTSRRRNAVDKSAASAHQASAHTHTAPGLVKTESCPNLGDEAALIEGSSPKSRGRLRGREGLTAEEKAELVRQRNREHARAARRRKKRYVEQLQQQVTELLQQQNSTDAGRPNTTAAEASGTPRKDLSGVRRATLQRFLTYRTSQGRGHVVTEAEWRRVIDDNFSLSQPWTPLRSTSANFIHKKIQGRGLNAVIEDAAAIEALVNMVRSHVSRSVNGVAARSVSLRTGLDDTLDKPSGAANAAATAATVNVECTMRPHDDLLIVGDVAMAQWFISTSGLIAAGHPRECSVDAMLRCTFEAGTHRLRELDMTYDVMSFITQLHQMNLLDPNIAGQAIVSSDDETSSVASAKDQSNPSAKDDTKKDGNQRRRSTKRSQTGSQTSGGGLKDEDCLSMVTPQDMSLSMMEVKEEEKDQEGVSRPKTRRSAITGANPTEGSNAVANSVALASMNAGMSVQQPPAPWLMQSVWPGAMMTQMNQMNQMNQQALQQMNQPWIAPFPTTIQGVQNQCNVMDPNSQSMVVSSMPTSCSMPNLAIFRNGSGSSE